MNQLTVPNSSREDTPQIEKGVVSHSNTNTNDDDDVGHTDNDNEVEDVDIIC